MPTKSFDLLPGETILLKDAAVRHGFWAAFSGDLVLTDRALVYVDRGLITGDSRSYTRYGLDEISQVLIGKDQAGRAHLELYHTDGEDHFSLKSGGKRALRAWKKAIDKQVTLYGRQKKRGDNAAVSPHNGEPETAVHASLDEALSAVADVRDAAVRDVRELASGLLGRIGRGGGEGAGSQPADGREAALKKLEELREMGVLTADELEAKRRQVLGRQPLARSRSGGRH